MALIYMELIYQNHPNLKLKNPAGAEISLLL